MESSSEDQLALLVASDPRTERQLRRALGLLGCDLMIAESALDAAAVARRHDPHLAVIDLAWRRASALASIASFRQHPVSAAVPIAALCGRTQERDIADALDAGADAYVTRPLRLPLLLPCLEGLLNRSEPRRRPILEAHGPGLDSDDETWPPGGLRSLVIDVPPDTEEIASAEWSLFRAVEGAIGRCLETQSPLSALMMEVSTLDPMQRHEMAAFLTLVSERASAVLGQHELTPFGGRIFCGLLPETDEPGAVRAVKGVMTAVEDLAFPLPDGEARARVTFGVAICQPPFDYSPFRLVEWARRALRRAKAADGCGWWVYHPELIRRPT